MRRNKLLILSAAFALAISGCANAMPMMKRENPLRVDDIATYSLTPDGASTGSNATSYITTLTEFTHDGISWKMNQWNPSTLQIKTNQTSATSEFRFYNTSAFSGKITSVVITFKALTVSDASKLMFLGGDSEVTITSGGTAGTWNSTAKTLTWTPAASDDFTYFAFYQNGKAASGTNNLADTDAIVVSYSTAGTPAKIATQTSVSAENDKTTLDVTASPKDTVQLSANVTYEGGAVSNPSIGWSGNNNSVATISSTGLVTAVAKGTVRFTATYTDSGSTYYGSSGYIDITVANPNEVEFVAGVNVGSTSANGSADSVTVKEITMSSTDAAFATAEYRLYAGSTTTFSRSSDKKIASIAFTKTGSYDLSNLSVATGSSGTYSNGVWTGSATSVSFSAKAQVRLSKVVVTYYSGADVELDKGSLQLVVGEPSSVSVLSVSGINDPSYEWSITDGDECVELSNTRTDTVTVTPKQSVFGSSCILTLSVDGSNLETPIVRNISVTVCRVSSPENPFTISEARSAIDLADDTFTTTAYARGIISGIKEYLNSYSSITYWISSDGTTTNEIQVYSGKGLNGAAFSSESDIEVGATVVVKGTLKKYNSTYEFDKGNQLESYTLSTQQKVEKKGTTASLSYDYAQGTGYIDSLNRSFTGYTTSNGTSYYDWSDKTGSNGAVYAGNSAGGYESIQLKSDSSKGTGIVTTTSGGNATKVSVKWNSNTTAGRTIKIYGNTTAYEGSADLYNSTKRGTELGSIVCGTSNEVVINDEYQYIGILATGALYLDRINIQWGDAPFTITDATIRFRGMVSQALWEELDGSDGNITGFGVRLSNEKYLDGTKLKDATVDGTNVKEYNSAKSAPTLLHAADYDIIDEDTYSWNLRKKVSEANLTVTYVAVAYIVTRDNGTIFLNEVSASIQSLAEELMGDDAYDETSFDGSLNYLATLA